MVDEPAGASWFSTTILLALIGELIGLFFVARILARGGSPATTLNWVLVILIAPYVGLLLYYLLPRQLQLRRLRRRRSQLAWIEPTLDELVLQPKPAARHEDPLAGLLVRLDPDGVQDGNRLRLLETGHEFFQRAQEVIEAAREFVHVEAYIFRPDRTGLDVLELLTAAARRGVEVRLLYDSLGSWSLKARHLAPLRAAGGKAEAYMPLLWRRRPFTLNLRNHRKLVVVDGHTAFVGGRNVGDEYSGDRVLSQAAAADTPSEQLVHHDGRGGEGLRATARQAMARIRRIGSTWSAAAARDGKGPRWYDTMVEVQGPAVMRLHRTFVEDWYNAAEEDLASKRYFPEPEPAGAETVGVVESGPVGTSNFHWVLFQMITMAARSIDIASPYLIPDQTILTALQVAAARGVRVRIYTNSRHSESFVVYRAGRSYYRPLLEVGVQITETRHDYVHAKMILVDGHYLFVGSPNLDVRSTALNFEIGVVALGSPVCRDARRVLDQWIGAGVPMRLEDVRPTAVSALIEGLCRLTSPLL